MANRRDDRVKTAAAALASALLLGAAGALARPAPQPLRPVSADLYSGRWYEIARTPNTMQKDCLGPTTDFQGWSNGAFSVVETCHKRDPSGPAKVVHVRARILHPPDYARFQMSFMAGLVHQEYWILDHADDNSWALMGTPGGNFVWLLSRRPELPREVLTAALGRLEVMGYATSRLIYPAQVSG